uniref:Uncharacterized protein n=1 Tax=Tanacetum cinerariifolium TaxID=118510 RepID=A0A6L2KCP3_TANCI|nr:hypothetical protein [Tanacetum cinerariifolium]
MPLKSEELEVLEQQEHFLEQLTVNYQYQFGSSSGCQVGCHGGIESENNSSENALSKLVNETQMQMQDEKVDMGKTMDDGLDVKECSATESDKQVTSGRSGNDTTHAVDVDIILVND